MIFERRENKDNGHDTPKRLTASYKDTGISNDVSNSVRHCTNRVLFPDNVDSEHDKENNALKDGSLSRINKLSREIQRLQSVNNSLQLENQNLKRRIRDLEAAYQNDDSENNSSMPVVANPFVLFNRQNFPSWDEAIAVMPSKTPERQILDEDGNLDFSIDTLSALNASLLDKVRPNKVLDNDDSLDDSAMILKMGKLPILHLQTPTKCEKDFKPNMKYIKPKGNSKIERDGGEFIGWSMAEMYNLIDKDKTEEVRNDCHNSKFDGSPILSTPSTIKYFHPRYNPPSTGSFNLSPIAQSNVEKGNIIDLGVIKTPETPSSSRVRRCARLMNTGQVQQSTKMSSESKYHVHPTDVYKRSWKTKYGEQVSNILNDNSLLYYTGNNAVVDLNWLMEDVETPMLRSKEKLERIIEGFGTKKPWKTV